MASMFIPKKLKVGFQNRQGTFTGKLAYVIYYDNKDVLRKESSWNSWCDKSIPSIEIDNTPIKGFVINKDVQRNGYWGSGRSMVRVHHPDNFEFEISVDNLIGILMHGDCNNRELQQECVFAWLGTELVLLPTNSVEYQASLEFTERQDLKVSAKDLIKGATYQKRKDDSKYVYLGYFEWFAANYHNGGYDSKLWKSKGKKHIFAYQYNPGSSWYIEPVTVNTFSHCIDDQIHEKYAELVDKFQKSTVSSPVVEFKRIPTKEASEQFDAKSLTLYFRDGTGNEQKISRNFYVDGDNRWFLNDWDRNSYIVEPFVETRKWGIRIITQYGYYRQPQSPKIFELKSTFEQYNRETMTNETAFEIFDAAEVYCMVGVLENGNEVLL